MGMDVENSNCEFSKVSLQHHFTTEKECAVKDSNKCKKRKCNAKINNYLKRKKRKNAGKSYMYYTK